MLLAAACGGDDGSDDASPSPSTTSVTTSSARPDPLGADELPASGPIAAGSYVATEMTPPLRLDIPAGWEASMAETRRFTLTSGDASVTLIQRNELVDELLEMMTG